MDPGLETTVASSAAASATVGYGTRRLIGVPASGRVGGGRISTGCTARNHQITVISGSIRLILNHRPGGAGLAW